MNRIPRHCSGAHFTNVSVVGLRRIFSRNSSTQSEEQDARVTNTNNFYDVVIAGGGMVGTAMACAIDVGAWDHICSMRQKPAKFMHVWDACSDAAVTFEPSIDIDDDNIAYIVENNLTISAFVQRLSKFHKSQRITIKEGARIRNYEIPIRHDQGLVKLYLENDEIIETALLIGSDGANSMVRKCSNIKTIGWNYNQMSIVATLHLSSETNDNSGIWQRFLPTSTIAILPLTDTLCSLVWTAEQSLARRLMSMTDDQFVAEINSAFISDADTNRNLASLTNSFSDILQSVIQNRSPVRQMPPKIVGIDADSRGFYKVRMGHATQYVAPRVALIGDAVHQVHPHAGQGVNLGFGDVMCLQKTLDEAVSCGYDVGSIGHLVQYERERQREVLPILAAIELLYRQFATNWSPIVAIRGLGLSVVNAYQPIKDFFRRNVN